MKVDNICGEVVARTAIVYMKNRYIVFKLTFMQNLLNTCFFLSCNPAMGKPLPAKPQAVVFQR